MGANGLVGRERELDLIRRFLHEAAAGGAALILSGEPGVGKSVLLDAAAQEASAKGFRVMRAAGAEFETDVGYSGLNQLLLWPPREGIDRLAPAQRDALRTALGMSAAAPANRLVVSTAVLTLLRQTESPLLLVVDDLQWLDRPSAAVLSFVARRLTGGRAGLLAAARTGMDTFFDRADPGGGIAEHELRPLDAAAATDLLGARFPGLADGVRQRVLTEARGNPLALLELPAALSSPQLSAEQALPEVLPLSRRLQSLYAGRIAELPMPTRDLLLLAALDGTGDLGVLQSLGDLAGLAAAEKAGLVGVEEGRLAFRHPLVRSSMVNFATHGERRRAHRSLADALTGWPDRRAWHLAHATSGSDEQIAALLEEASQRALRRGDAAGGVAALLRAADLSPRGADRSRRLVEAAYVGAEITGELRNVSRLLADAGRADPHPRGSHPRGSLRAAVATAYQLLNGEGDVDTAHRLLVAAIQASPFRRDDRALTEAMLALLLVCSFGGRSELWQPFRDAMARLGPRPPALLSVAANLFADPARATPAALTELDSLIARLPQEADPVRIVWTGRSALFLDRVPACREALQRLIRDGHSGGAVACAIAAAITLSWYQLQSGEWDQAQRLSGDALRLCATHGYRMMEWSLWYVKATIAAARGEFKAARELTDRMVAWASPRRAETVRAYAARVRALAALGLGDPEEAFHHAAAISPPGALAAHAPLALWAAPELVEAAVRTGRHEEAAAHVRAMRDAGLAALSPRLALTVAGCAAVAGCAPFHEATAIPGVERWPFELARVRLAHGERRRRARGGGAGEARTELNAALEIFERLDARPWAERARSELRATGHSRGSATLTSQEREIALLAATGLTNKQVGQRLHLSHRTIGAHLYRIFPKLGITSRAALRDALDACALEEDLRAARASSPALPFGGDVTMLR